MFGSSGGTGFGSFGQQNNAQQPGQSGGLFGQPQQQQQQGQAGSTGGFGGFGAQSTPAFGGNAGGAAGGGLFGQTQQAQQPSSGFQFGQTNAATSSFGQPKPAGAFGGFGAAASTPSNTTGAFGGFGGANTTNSQPAFGAASSTDTNAFGAKPAGSLFGQPQAQQQQSGLFGQPAASGGGLFGGGGVGGLSAQQTGGMPTQGTSNPQYQPFVSTEKDATGSGSTNYQYNTITCLPAYRAASLEELRLQDYQQGRKSGNAGPTGFGQPAATGGFGQPAASGGGLFGQAQQTPQQPSQGFGSGGSLFGQSNQQQTGGGLFGQNNANTGGGLFGQNNAQQTQPGQTGGGLFGQTNTQQSSTGFGGGFGQQQSQGGATSGFTFGQNTAQQNKPGGLFGGTGGTFGSTNQQQPASSGFTFGGTSQPAQTGFGATSSSGGFGFGASATANQPKPGGLFGGQTSSAPSFGGFGSSAPAADANKPAFSFGGSGGAFGSSAPGQTTTAAPTGGLFGQSAQPQPSQQQGGLGQSSTGFTFGANSNNQQSNTGTNSTFSFGSAQQQQQPNASSGFGSGGSLFGQNKPAATGGGLFGSLGQNSQTTGQQAGSTGFTFGGANNTSGQTGTTGGLFGASNNKSTTGGGLFGGSFGATGTSAAPQTNQTGGLFGSLGANNNRPQAGTGLFGTSTQPANSGGLFGASQPANNFGASGSQFGNSSFGNSTFGAGAGQQQGSSLFGGNQSTLQSMPNLQTSLNANPYGTDALFGGAASLSASSNFGASNAASATPQALLPFNVSRPAAKKQAPLVPPFRPSPRNTARISKLRGSTPTTFRNSSTPAREGSPALFSPASTYTRLSSPSVVGGGQSLFRGLSDEASFSQRESSLPAAPLPSQAFVNRPSVKRLVLDDQPNRSGSITTNARSQSLFASTIRNESSGNTSRGFDSVTPSKSLFDRTTPAATGNRVTFSPALETSASPHPGNGQSRTSALFGNESTLSPSQSRRDLSALGDTPSKVAADGFNAGVLPPINSKKALSNAASKVNREDSLLPLDYYTLPPLSELREWSHAELRAVEGFIVGRKGFGQVAFAEPVDLTTVGELINVPGGIVQLRKKECYVYPDDDECFDPETGNELDGVQPGFDPKRVPGGKAKRGQGLNVPAIVQLEGCWPIDRSTRQPIKDGEHARVKQLVHKLKRRTDSEFRDYEPLSGTWTFRVEHFSRYGLDDEDDEEPMEEGGNENSKKKKDDQGGNKPKPQADTNPQGDRAPLSQDKPGSSKERPAEFKSADVSNRTAGISRATPQPSEAGSQPWAASLGLEARRMQVMQASFFGANDSKEQPTSAASLQSPRKQALQTDEPADNVLGLRRNFDTPMNSTVIPTAGNKAPKQSSKGGAKTNIELLPSLSTHTDLFLTTRPSKIAKSGVDVSTTDNAHDVILDAGLFMGRSFRVGWGPNGALLSRSAISAQSEASEAKSNTVSSILGSKLTVFSKPDDQMANVQFLRTLLDVQLRHSVVEVDEEEDTNADGGCPVIFPSPDLRFRHFVASMDSVDDGQASNKRYEESILRLASALFDEINLGFNERDTPLHLVERATSIRRKNNVVNWLQWCVNENVRYEVRSQLASTNSNRAERIIFILLSAGLFEEACKHALESGNYRLATLLAQANGGGSDEEFRLDLLDQLSVWRTSGSDAFISSEYRRIIELLSGNVGISKGNEKREKADRVNDMFIAAGLDWKRTFSLFLHFQLPFEAGLDQVVESYEQSVGQGQGDDDVIVPPLPPYLERDVKPGSKRFRDLIRRKVFPIDTLFALLKLFTQADYPLEGVLDARQYTSDTFNVGLTFHLGQMLSRVLGVRDFDDRVNLGIDGETLARLANVRGNSARHDSLCVQYALELELLGLWTWSAFVLLHLELKESRAENVKALLSRHVDQLSQKEPASSASQDEAFLVNVLKIPKRWIDEARANQAEYQNDRYSEYNHLLSARLYTRAHLVATCYLAPEAVVRHDLSLILRLFAPFRRSAIVSAKAREQSGEQNVTLDDEDDLERSLEITSDDIHIRGNRKAAPVATADDDDGEIEVAGWQAGGQVFLDYIATCRTLPWLVANHASALVDVVDEAQPVPNTVEDYFALLLSVHGPEVAHVARRIDRMASHIPQLVQRIDELFDVFIGSRGHKTTITVARSQMLASLLNCIRSLKATRTLARLATLIPSLDVDVHSIVSANVGAARTETNTLSTIEIETLQYMANDYCDALVQPPKVAAN